jgi:N-acetylglucosaminyl-diphospho-decaprenol L-rhamnosyltransferase
MLQARVGAELAVIVVSYNSREWLGPCLSSVLAHSGEIELDIVVVDNQSSDGSAELVEREFPQVRVIRGPNRGFAYGNNRGVIATDAPFVLFLNPDAEIAGGSLGGLLGVLRERPEVGLAGCRQIDHEGALYPTIRRFPNAVRLFFDGLGAERFPFRAKWLGERELDLRVYENEASCDWTSGAFMLARTEALLAAGLMDERFFLYGEEPDLCLRIKTAGWEIRHFPGLTIRHPWDRIGFNSRLVAQEAYARRQYIHKHFSPLHRVLAIASIALGHALRGALGGHDTRMRAERRAASRLALRTLIGLEPPPFGPPPRTALDLQGDERQSRAATSGR